jgi:hypothetical protein
MSVHWDNSFQPDEVQVLSAAFERAWGFIETSGDVGMDVPWCRSCLAAHVMEIARTGDMNPLRLTNEAIARYRQQRALFTAAFGKPADAAE